ncbi:hypothetical protein BDW66DRAFT_162941 [Aspergillus desertorum]
MDCDPDLAAPVDWAEFDQAVRGLNLSAFYAHDAGLDKGQGQLEGSMNNPVKIDNMDTDLPDVPATLAGVRPTNPTAPANKASEQTGTCAWAPYDAYRPLQKVQPRRETDQQGPGAWAGPRVQPFGSTLTSISASEIRPGRGSSFRRPNLASQLNHARTQLHTCREIIKELQCVVMASSDGELVRRLLNAVVARDREAEASQRELKSLEDKCEKYKKRWSREYAQNQESRKKIARYEQEFGKMEYQVKALQMQLKLARSERDRLSGRLKTLQ